MDGSIDRSIDRLLRRNVQVRRKQLTHGTRVQLIELQVGRRIGSRADKFQATNSSPSNCNSTDYSGSFHFRIGLRQLLRLSESLTQEAVKQWHSEFLAK